MIRYKSKADQFLQRALCVAMLLPGCSHQVADVGLFLLGKQPARDDEFYSSKEFLFFPLGNSGGSDHVSVAVSHGLSRW